MVHNFRKQAQTVLSNQTNSFFVFHSNLEGDASTLELGQEVEYTLGGRSNSGSCLSAEAVKLLPKGTIQLSITVGEEVLDGQVVRPLRSVNPDQSEYAGLITTDPGNF